MDADPFSKSAMARCQLFLEPHFRKARLRSRGDVAAARGRLHSYAMRSAGVQREMVRRVIGAASFNVGSHVPSVPERANPHPFTSDEVVAMSVRVQAAADQALTEAAGDVPAARIAMWRAAGSSPELAQAICGLQILALS